jgi:hypothetical protein
MQLTLNNATPNQMEAIMEISKVMKEARKVECYNAYPYQFTEWDKEWGYNESSGNVYCALDNGITIAAPDFASGDVSFYIYTEEEGEVECDTYIEAYAKLHYETI